jgi:drug/metabolite transporter (DMT)-like permease
LWLAGIASDGLGFVAQAAALGVGGLAVVQPLLVTSVVFALPLGVRLSGQHARRGDVAAAVLVVIALAGFLTIANPSGGRSEAPLTDWLVVAIVCAAVCAPLALLGRGGPKPRRAAMLGTATGVLFALTAALTKAVGNALTAVGYTSMTLYQLALNTGALAATIATSGALDPIASVVLGLTLFHESLRVTAFQAVGTIIALTVALLGMAVLARSEAQPAPTSS